VKKSNQTKGLWDEDRLPPWHPRRAQVISMPDCLKRQAPKRGKAKPTKKRAQPTFDEWRELRVKPSKPARRPSAPVTSKVLYYAFGSNMEEGQMKRRCPSATGGRFVSLKGYSLTFCGHSKGWGGAVATIRHDEQGIVYGRVWEVSWNDLIRLDGFEGHPYVYERRLMTLDDGTEAMIYIKPIKGDVASPSESYFTTIARGYQQVDLALDKLVDAVG
jgi:gamma-glutamylcyclotransferase